VPHRFRHLDTLILAFVCILMISNLVAGKIVAIGPNFSLSGAQILFPVTYIFGDIFTEVYGYAASRRAIWTGFMAAALLGVMGNIIVALPPAPGWPHQAAYETVFHQVPRILVASLVAFWLGEFANAFVLAKMKVLTGGRMLWSRTVGSTVVGQLVDTVVVVAIVFAGVVPVSEMVKLMYSGYFGKVIYEALATPVTYLVVNWLKRVEGVDVFDNATDFNPFSGGAVD
jgi:uncharacterized integral membrane protein (TIGR00697 family)